MKRNFPFGLKAFSILYCIFCLATACKKDTDLNQPMNAQMKAGFNYKPGTYWIYKDSVTGVIDSAYVVSNDVNYFTRGCVLYDGQPKYEQMDILINMANGDPSDSERWTLSLSDTTCTFRPLRRKDTVESSLYVTLFHYPLKVEPANPISSCVLLFDSGAVTDIVPVMSFSGQNFVNAARSKHDNISGTPCYSYNDCFYVNEDAGIIKLVFNHPQDSVYRVLELQRFRIVK